MKVEYIRNESVFSFDHKLSNEDYVLFYAGELDGHYEREYIFQDNVSELKQEIINQIDLFIQDEISKGFEYNGRIYSMSIKAQLNWSNILNIPAIMFPINIMSMNEELYSLPLSEQQTFYNTILSFKYGKLNHGHQLKQSLAELNTAEEILSFVIE
jgi:hypothetical protein